MSRSGASAVAQYLKEKEALERTLLRHEESRRQAAMALGERLIAAGALELKLPKLARIVELSVAAGEDAAVSVLSGVVSPVRGKLPKADKPPTDGSALSMSGAETPDVQ